MIFAFYFFSALLVFLGWKSLRGGIAYLKFFQTEIAKPKSDFAPFVSIIAPCRGLDEGLQSNLAALFRQSFPRYEIVFVVGDERDEAVEIIEKVSREAISQNKSKLIIAGKTIDSSQKVHNLRQAVKEVSAESEVFVFVDSDARPDTNWLRNLIAPLENKNVGAATGYRWFVSKKGNFAPALRSVWNASIASALGANEKTNFCWGGSMAIRRETFEKLDLRQRLKGTVSDDYTFTRVLTEANLLIRFVPQALTATVEDCSFRELLEFTTRQMKITRVYAPHLWKLSFVGSFLFSIIFWTGFVLLFFLSNWQFWLALAFLLTIFALGAGKAYLRLKAVKVVLKDYENELNRSFLWQTTLWTITPLLFFYNNFSALLSREILWRGIKYELKSPRETVIITDNEE
ncbi:MAG: glycosyltransferase [Acidobacteriota bacterium]|nr:glycosyltransferase [Acidobacteriota bacterium]